MNKFNLPDAINASTSKDFSIVANSITRNPNISGKAKSILTLLLSNKEGWTTYFTTMKTMMQEGEDALRSGVAELEKHQLLIRVKYRDKITKKFVGSFWAYTDNPGSFRMEWHLKTLESHGWEPVFPNRKPRRGKPYRENPDMANPGLIIYKDNKIKDKKSKSNLKITNSSFSDEKLSTSIKDDSLMIVKSKTSSSMKDKIKQKLKGKKKAPTINKKPDPFISFWNLLPNTPHHKSPETKIYKSTKRLLRELRVGRFGKSKTWNKEWLKRNKIPAQYLNGKKWTDKEIQEGLRRLALHFIEGYWPEDKKHIPHNLHDLLYNPRTQSSWFLRDMVNEPSPLQSTFKPDYIYHDEDYYEADGTIKAEFRRGDEINLVNDYKIPSLGEVTVHNHFDKNKSL